MSRLACHFHCDPHNCLNLSPPICHLHSTTSFLLFIFVFSWSLSWPSNSSLSSHSFLYSSTLMVFVFSPFWCWRYTLRQWLVCSPLSLPQCWLLMAALAITMLITLVVLVIPVLLLVVALIIIALAMLLFVITLVDRCGCLAQVVLVIIVLTTPLVVLNIVVLTSPLSSLQSRCSLFLSI